MSDNPKEAEREMGKAIFIPGDCWLSVFDFLAPSQLGLVIALISRRFDFFVDEHFKTRRWALKNKIQIKGKIGMNGAKEMKIVSSDGKALPIPQNPLPNKVTGFGSIEINYFDHNVLTFLRHFHRFFSVCITQFDSATENVRISEFAVLNIWQQLKDTIRVMLLNSIAFRQMRQFAPSLLNDCPTLRFVIFFGGISLAFPPDDSANASDGQAVAKWLFSPRPDNLPKMLKIENLTVDQWLAIVEQIKAIFVSASSPVNFIISVYFPPSFSLFYLFSIVPFELTNKLTGEKLTLLHDTANLISDADDEIVFLIIRRRPIMPDERQNIEELRNGWNRIDIFIADDGVDNGLLDGLPGPSGDH